MLDSSSMPNDGSDFVPRQRYPAKVLRAYYQLCAAYARIARQSGHNEPWMLTETGLQLYRASKNVSLAILLGRTIATYVGRGSHDLKQLAQMATERLGKGHSYQQLAHLACLADVFGHLDVTGLSLSHLKVLIDKKMHESVRLAGIEAIRKGGKGGTVKAVTSLVRRHKRLNPW